MGDPCPAFTLYLNQFGKKRSTGGVCIYLQGGVAGLATRPHFAYPGLFDELAVGIVVGDSGGDAGPTRL